MQRMQRMTREQMRGSPKEVIGLLKEAKSADSIHPLLLLQPPRRPLPPLPHCRLPATVVDRMPEDGRPVVITVPEALSSGNGIVQRVLHAAARAGIGLTGVVAKRSTTTAMNNVTVVGTSKMSGSVGVGVTTRAGGGMRMRQAGGSPVRTGDMRNEAGRVAGATTDGVRRSGDATDGAGAGPREAAGMQIGR